MHFVFSLRQRDLCQELIEFPLVRAADDAKGDMPPANCSRPIRGSVAAQIAFVYQGGVRAARRSASYGDRFDRSVTAWSVLEPLDGGMWENVDISLVHRRLI